MKDKHLNITDNILKSNLQNIYFIWDRGKVPLREKKNTV